MTFLLCAFLVGAATVAAGGRQTTPGAVLPDTVRTHLRTERFQIVTSIRGLPLGVRNELETLFGSYTLDIAEPGAPFRSGGTASDPALPSRRLITAGCSYDHCLVYYERGGASRTWRAAVFDWTPDRTRLEFGGSAPGGLGTLEAVRDAVLSGAIGDAGGTW